MTVRKNLSLMGVAHLISFILNFAAVIVVSRILTPMEIGIYSVSVAVLGIAHIFRDFGVGQYLVQVKEVGKQQLRAAFTVTLLSSFLLALILFLARQPMATLYDNQGVADVLSVLCLNFLILPFGAPLLSLMQRDLQFNYLAINTIVSTVVQTGVTVGLAFAGYSYMSMAWGAFVALIVKVILLNALRPGQIFMWPTFKGLGEAFRFGSLASMASIIRELGQGAPDLILGRTLGFVEVAFFSRANGLNKMLVERIVALVRGVYFPTFTSELRKGGDGAALYSKSMIYLVAVTAPILAVLAVVAEPLIVFLFGEQWQRAGLLASFICGYAVLTTPYSFYSLSLIAAGKVTRNLWLETTIQSAQIAVLLTSIWLPLEQVVALFLIVAVVQIIGAQYALKRTFGLRFGCHMRLMAPSLLLIPMSIAGPAVVIYVTSLWSFDSQLLILLCSAATATLGWVGGLYLIGHPMRSEVENFLRILRAKFSSLTIRTDKNP